MKSKIDLAEQTLAEIEMLYKEKKYTVQRAQFELGEWNQALEILCEGRDLEDLVGQEEVLAKVANRKIEQWHEKFKLEKSKLNSLEDLTERTNSVKRAFEVSGATEHLSNQILGEASPLEMSNPSEEIQNIRKTVHLLEGYEEISQLAGSGG